MKSFTKVSETVTLCEVVVIDATMYLRLQFCCYIAEAKAMNNPNLRT